MSATVMVKYGELFLKSESVQRYYTKLLTKNIRAALTASGLTGDIVMHRGRILIGDDEKGDDLEKILKVVSKIFGLVGVCIAQTCGNDIESLGKTAAALAKPKLHAGMSFAVRGKRSNIKGFTSQDLGRMVGDMVYETAEGLSVDLTNPDYEVFVEARKEGGLVYDTVLPGPGGLPLGTQGRVLSLISAGIDSPVASWLMMKRGCTISYLHFEGGKYFGCDTIEAAKENISHLSLWTAGYNQDMYSVNIEPFYDALVKIPNLKNRCLICKRFMLRCASLLVRRYGYGGIVMGNNLAQVASQTLKNMAVVGEVVPSSIPLFQPLLTYDKEDSVNLARKIGTFRENAGDLGCGVVPKHPAVSAELSDVLADESQLDLEGLAVQCLESSVRYRALNGSIVTTAQARGYDENESESLSE